MRSSALLCCLVVYATGNPDYSDTWEEFKEKYGKESNDADEEVKTLEWGWAIVWLTLVLQDYRKNVWSSNVDFISSHNTEYEAGVHDFSVGEKEFADSN